MGSIDAARQRSRAAVVLIVSAALAGCAVSRQQFAQEKYSLSNERVCRTWQSGDKDHSFAADVQAELDRRGIRPSDCAEIVSRQDTQIVAGAVAVLAVAALAVAASRSSGSGSSYAPSSSDYDWDWDQFYNSYGQLVWSCRGVQTGQFAELDKCQYKYKSDARWPSKQAP